MTSIWRFFTSLRLTVVCLAFAIGLVFLGTIAQVHEGLWNAQERWFRHYVVFRASDDPWWVPPIYPGGYLIGFTLLANLIAAHIKRFHLSWKKMGINLTHAGIILLLLGILATDKFAQESIMNIHEGETRYFSETSRRFELAFIRSVDGEKDEMVTVPQEMLREGATLTDARLPVQVRVLNYWINSEPQFRAPMQQNGPQLTDNGIAKDFDFKPMPEAKGMDVRNLPTALVELTGKKGEPLGKWVLASWADDEIAREGLRNAYKESVGADVAGSIYSKLIVPQTVETDGVTWRVALRPERVYREYGIKLLSTTHDVYPGTITSTNLQGIPRNFASRLDLINPGKGERREVDISMNNPLRYEGLTFYQSTMGRDEVVDKGRSGLQVVKNPSWLAPYFGCGIVALGMCWQFLYHLVGFISKRRNLAPA